MEIKQTNTKSMDKGKRKGSVKRGLLTAAAIFFLGFLLASCSVPRYGGYDGYGHHHYMIEDSSGGQYDGSR